MTAEQFAYWLNGYAELHGKLPSEQEWLSIKEHLRSVFIKVTPNVIPPFSSERIKVPHYEVEKAIC